MSGLRAAVLIGLTSVFVCMAAAFQFAPPGKPGGLNGVQEFSSSGTWVAPPEVSHVRVTMWGGGGGAICRVGGGAGAYTDTVVPVTPGKTYTVTVGMGGAVGGSNGGDSQFVAPDGTVLAFAGGGKGGLAGGQGGQADNSAQISHPGKDQQGFGGAAYDSYLAPDNREGTGNGASDSHYPACEGFFNGRGNPGFVFLVY